MSEQPLTPKQLREAAQRIDQQRAEATVLDAELKQLMVNEATNFLRAVGNYADLAAKVLVERLDHDYAVDRPEDFAAEVFGIARELAKENQRTAVTAMVVLHEEKKWRLPPHLVELAAKYGLDISQLPPPRLVTG